MSPPGNPPLHMCEKGDLPAHKGTVSYEGQIFLSDAPNHQSFLLGKEVAIGGMPRTLAVLNSGFSTIRCRTFYDLALLPDDLIARCPGQGRQDYDRTFIWCLFLSKDLLLVISRLSQRK